MPDESSECISSLSGADAILLLEIIHESLSCGSEEAFFVLFPKIQKLIHFDYALATMGRKEC